MKKLLVGILIMVSSQQFLYAQISKFPSIYKLQKELANIHPYDTDGKQQLYFKLFEKCAEKKDYVSLTTHLAEYGKVHIGLTPNYDTAIYYINLAEELALKHNIKSVLVKAELYKAYYYSVKNDRSQSTQYIQKAKQSFHKIKDMKQDTIRKEELFLLIGDIYKVFNIFDSSLLNYEVALEEAIRKEDYNFEIKTNLRIAELREQTVQGDFKTSARIYRSILANPEQKTDSASLSIAARKLAFIMVENKQIDSAKLLLHFAYNINKKTGKLPTFILAKLSQIFSEEGRTDSAIYYLKIAETMPQTDMSRLQMDLAYAYAYLAMEDIGAAEYYNQKAMVRAANKPEIGWVRDALKQKIQIETKNNDFESAYNSLKSLKYWEDSLMSFDRQKALFDLKEDFENVAAIRDLERKNEIQQLELQRRNLQMIIIIIVFISVLLIIYLIYNRKMLKRDKQTNELNQKLLRLQLNPHFIFNALSSIQSFIMTNNTREASISLAQFGELTRDILDTSSEAYITLSREVKMMHNYVEIQRIRFEGSVNFEVTIEEAIDQESVMIPPMFIQPFIENSFEHGLARNKGGIIRLSINKGHEVISITIEDNGGGLPDQNTGSNHASKAISIIRERIERLKTNGKKLKDLEIGNIISDGKVSGVSVKFELPLITT